eukprot:COSAG06_NODE_5583_length_3385_cov_7.013390_2_plen_206_part_00
MCATWRTAGGGAAAALQSAWEGDGRARPQWDQRCALLRLLLLLLLLSSPTSPFYPPPLALPLLHSLSSSSFSVLLASLCFVLCVPRAEEWCLPRVSMCAMMVALGFLGAEEEVQKTVFFSHTYIHAGSGQSWEKLSFERPFCAGGTLLDAALRQRLHGGAPPILYYHHFFLRMIPLLFPLLLYTSSGLATRRITMHRSHMQLHTC